MGRATQPPSKFLAALTTGNLRGLFPIHKWNANCHSSTLRRHRAHCCPPTYFRVRRCMDVLSQRPPIRLPMPYSDISLTRRMPLYPQQDCRQPKKRPIRADSDSHCRRKRIWLMLVVGLHATMSRPSSLILPFYILLLIYTIQNSASARMDAKTRITLDPRRRCRCFAKTITPIDSVGIQFSQAEHTVGPAMPSKMATRMSIL